MSDLQNAYMETERKKMYAKDLLWEIESLKPSDAQRNVLLNKLLPNKGQYVFIEPGFRCDFGFNIYFEGVATINSNCTFMDSEKMSRCCPELP